MSKRVQTFQSQDVVVVHFVNNVIGESRVVFFKNCSELQLQLLRRLNNSNTARESERADCAKAIGELLAFFDLVEVDMCVQDLLRSDQRDAIQSLDKNEFDWHAFEAECNAHRRTIVNDDHALQRVQTFPVRITEMITFTHCELD